MQNRAESILIGLLALTAPAVTGCNDPQLVLETPRDQSVVTSPVAARISWSAINTFKNGMAIQLDGQPANNQFSFGYALVTDAATAMLRLENGAHTLSATAELLDTSTQQYVTSTVTSNFQVVDAIFNVSIAPGAFTLKAGHSATATVSVVRTSAYTDQVDLTVIGLPTGVTSSGGSIPANQTSTVITFTANAQQTQSGTFNVMLTGTGTVPPAQTIMFPMTTVTAPTFTQLYSAYFDHAPASTPGHCYNCHQSAPASNFFAPGADKAGFYQGLVNANLIDVNSPATSRLGNPATSPLRWVNPNGAMPKDQPVANAQARDDISDWLNAGAQNN